MNKLLILCLLLPATGLIAIFVFKISFGIVLTYGIFLLCPLMHIFMMKGHGHGGQKEKDNSIQNGKSYH